MLEVLKKLKGDGEAHETSPLERNGKKEDDSAAPALKTEPFFQKYETKDERDSVSYRQREKGSDASASEIKKTEETQKEPEPEKETPSRLQKATRISEQRDAYALSASAPPKALTNEELKERKKQLGS